MKRQFMHLAVVVAALACALPAHAVKTYKLADGATVKASEIPDNAEIIFDQGEATIVVDTHKTFRRIWPGHNNPTTGKLTIQGGYSITINASTTSTSVSGTKCDKAILVGSLTMDENYSISGADVGIYAYGDVNFVSVSNISYDIKAKKTAIHAEGDINVYGSLSAETTQTSDHTVSTIECNNLTLAARGIYSTHITSAASRAVRCNKLVNAGATTITATGQNNPAVWVQGALTTDPNPNADKVKTYFNVTATGSNSVAVWASYYNLSSPFTANAGSRAVEIGQTATGFVPKYPQGVTQPQDYSLQRPSGSTYRTVCRADGTPSHLVEVTTPAQLFGSLDIAQGDSYGNVYPGMTLTPTGTDMVKQYLDNGADIGLLWMLYDADQNYTVSRGNSYKVPEVAVGGRIRLAANPTGINGSAESKWYNIVKHACTGTVVAPTLTISDDYKYVIVTNAQPNQEYVVYTGTYNWESAVTPTGTATTLQLAGTTGTINKVVTRIKATADTYASTEEQMAEVYLGQVSYTQGIKLTPKQSVLTTIGVREREMLFSLLTDNYNAHYCKLGDVIKITAEPIPADASNFNGITASNWVENAKNGTFYADAKCTTALTSGTLYKEVYFKPGKQQNFVELQAYITLGYNNIARDAFYLHVADADDNVLISTLNVGSVTVERGKSKSTQVGTTPSRAYVGDMTATRTNTSAGGTAPTIAFSTLGNNKYMRVNATAATAGTYQFDLLQKGTKVASTVVTVTETPLESVTVSPEAITDAEPGDTYQLTASLYPADATMNKVTWTTTDASIATVDANGLVTITGGAAIGGSAMIIATADNKADTCTVTIGGKVYDLWLAGVRVTSRNMSREKLSDLVASVAGDEAMERYFNGENRIEFDGTTLTLENATIECGTTSAICSSGGLEIRLVGDNRIAGRGSSGEAVLAGGGLVFTGSGSLTQSGCLLLDDGRSMGSLMLLDSVQVTIDSRDFGVDGSLSLSGVNAWSYFDSPTATLRVRGAIGSFVHMWSLGLDGVELLEPAGAYFSQTDNRVVDSQGNTVTDWVVIGAKSGSGLVGDVNGDGTVDVADVNEVVNVILGTKTPAELVGDPNVDGEGDVDIADVNALINIILSK